VPGEVFHDTSTKIPASLVAAMVDLVHRNLRDHIRVVLAQFLFSNSQY
jgi:hypothetical protein